MGHSKFDENVIQAVKNKGTMAKLFPYRSVAISIIVLTTMVISMLLYFGKIQFRGWMILLIEFLLIGVIFLFSFYEYKLLEIIRKSNQ